MCNFIEDAVAEAGKPTELKERDVLDPEATNYLLCSGSKLNI
jgi:hypothetical protein